MVFADALRQALGEKKVILDLIEDAEHLTPKLLSDENLDRVFRFLNGRLKTP